MDLLFGVQGRVFEGDDLPGLGVDEDLPAARLRRSMEAERPDQTVAVPFARLAGESLTRLVLGRRERDDLQDRLLPQLVLRRTPACVVEAQGLRLIRGERGLRVDLCIAPVLGAQQHQVAVVDRRHDATVPDSNAVQLLRNADLPEVIGHGRRERRTELIRVDPDQVRVLHDEGPHQIADDPCGHLIHVVPEIGGQLLEGPVVAPALSR